MLVGPHGPSPPLAILGFERRENAVGGPVYEVQHVVQVLPGEPGAIMRHETQCGQSLGVIGQFSNNALDDV